MRSFYVTTPIYYVNDMPHIGHIYTTLVADTIARYRRLAGDSVRLLTGTDEHGQKIERAAAERGLKPLELADEVVARYHEIWQRLDVSHDDFIRTSEARHAPAVAEVIRRIAEHGDLYTDRHEGWYCVSCETFYTEKELLADRHCPIHERPAERRAEENVFFRLSRYQEPLLELYDRQPPFVCPESRANEVRQFVAGGLRDLSVSRPNVDWGIPFPGHDGQTVYVWLDALTNYISALGFGADSADLYERFWRDGDVRLHLIGKDILRFHAVYWPAFLMSAGLPLPTTVWAHGWWLRDARKVSKSDGNIVRPDHLIDRFGGDVLRFFLLREMVFGQDAGFSDEAFAERYNSDLANGLGNTVSRLVTLSRRTFAERTPPSSGEALREAAEREVNEYREAMAALAFHRALAALWRLLAEANGYLVVHEPWKKLKDPAARELVGEVLWTAMEAVRIVAVGLLPVMPDKAEEVLRALGVAPDGVDLKALAWGGLAANAELPEKQSIFPRVDVEKFLAEITAATDSANATDRPGQTQTENTDKTEGSMIDIDQFFATELRVATVLAAKPVPKSNKLLELSVDAGDEGPRTVVAGIARQYEPEALVGLQVVVVANLQPAKLMGVESNGMVLAASEDGAPVLLQPASPVAPGTRVR